MPEYHLNKETFILKVTLKYASMATKSKWNGYRREWVLNGYFMLKDFKSTSKPNFKGFLLMNVHCFVQLHILFIIY